MNPFEFQKATIRHFLWKGRVAVATIIPIETSCIEVV